MLIGKEAVQQLVMRALMIVLNSQVMAGEYTMATVSQVDYLFSVDREVSQLYTKCVHSKNLSK